jgi:hypothetical protein
MNDKDDETWYKHQVNRKEWCWINMELNEILYIIINFRQKHKRSRACTVVQRSVMDGCVFPMRIRWYRPREIFIPSPIVTKLCTNDYSVTYPNVPSLFNIRPLGVARHIRERTCMFAFWTCRVFPSSHAYRSNRSTDFHAWWFELSGTARESDVWGHNDNT